MKLKINIWTGVLDIVNCILFVFSWFFIAAASFSDAFNKTHSLSGTAAFFYIFAVFGLILNILAFFKSKKVNISVVGPVLGIIGNVLFLFGAILAFPAIILLIIAIVFTFLQRSTNRNAYINPNYQNNNYQNQNFPNQNYQRTNVNAPTRMTRSSRHHR